ncbi:hypothetical protein DSECCO2_530690 [anaerobic digester metagenome]
MQTKPLMWDDYYNSTNKTIEYKVVIGTEEYFKENLYSVAVSGSLCPDDNTFSLGKVCCRKLDITIFPKVAVISKMSNVDLYMRYNGANGPTAWLSKGKFYIDTRQKFKNKLILECYDSVLKMEKPFIQDEVIPDFPMSMPDALNVICTRLGLTLDNPTAINSLLNIEYPNEMTMREVAGYIASANAGNFIITDEGKLRLVVPAAGIPVESISVKSFDELNDSWTVSRVTMYYDDESYFTAGDDTADEIIIKNIWATQAMCNNVLALLNGYTHKPFICSGAYINPAVEPGDTVTVGTFIGIIFNAAIKYGANVVWEISAPGESQLEHEYPYEGSYARAIKQKVGLNTSYYGVTINRQNGLKISRTDGLSEAVFNSDVLAMRALEGGVMKDKIYFDPTSGKYIFDGELSANIINALSILISPNLYAGKATIAELTVDQLDTGSKVQNYLNEDTSAVNYIKIFDQYIQFITAVTDGTQSEYATDRNGARLYWTDSTKESASTDVTAYPVRIYAYTEHIKLQIEFDTDANNTPIITMGVGDGVTATSAKAIIRKGTTGLELNYYKSNTGDLTQLLIDDTGIVQTGNTGSVGLRNIAVGTAAPTSPQNNDLWIDTSGGV